MIFEDILVIGYRHSGDESYVSPLKPYVASPKKVKVGGRKPLSAFMLNSHGDSGHFAPSLGHYLAMNVHLRW